MHFPTTSISSSSSFAKTSLSNRTELETVTKISAGKLCNTKCRRKSAVLMKIIKAQHLGMCFGVRDAIALALSEVEHQPLTILGDLVHNETVLADLKARGLR